MGSHVSWCWLVTPGNFVNWDENNLCLVLTDVTGVTLGHNNMLSHTSTWGGLSQSEEADGKIDQWESESHNSSAVTWYISHQTP